MHAVYGPGGHSPGKSGKTFLMKKVGMSEETVKVREKLGKNAFVHYLCYFPKNISMSL